ncbi:MAG: hypothetical protein HYT89_05650 [Candidatus Omnitrophica bacterium]|nr:hypothetical protein [Candidatus Omnitrophota bacterium]
MTSERRKKWVKTGLVFLAVLFCLGLAKNLLIQTVVASSLSRAAHVPVSIGNTEVSLLAGSIRLKNLRFRNPAGYPEKWMVEIPEVFLDLHPGALWKGRIHVEEARFTVRLFSVIKDEKGRLNIQALKSAPGGRSATRAPAGRPVRRPSLKIDRLYLSLGKVFYKDYTGRAGQPPAVQEFDLGIQNRLYRDVHDPSTVVNLVVFEALTRTTISRLAGVDLSFFKESARSVLEEGAGGLADLVQEGTGTLTDTTESLFNWFK